jgi:hypothetical protein
MALYPFSRKYQCCQKYSYLMSWYDTFFFGHFAWCILIDFNGLAQGKAFFLQMSVCQLGPPGKFIFFLEKLENLAKIEKIPKRFSFSHDSKKFEVLRTKVRTFFEEKFEQSSNELRRNSSNSSIQVSPRCFVFRWCQFMIYIKICIT